MSENCSCLTSTSKNGRVETETFSKTKEALELFLEHHVISKEQYDKSLGDLRVKMGITDYVTD